MIYRKFKDKELSLLGMGCMRFPCIDGKDGEPDQAAVNEMVDYAMAKGINYYDTAYGYHEGNSQIVIGNALKKYPRESFYLANKFPGYDAENFGKIDEVFNEQLRKCQVDYFDFYLFHNVCESNIDAYLDDEIGLYDFLMQKKAEGKIRHLGFSCHGSFETMMRFIRKYGKDLEFCQIQLNYVDMELQDARLKVEALIAMGMPIWVMEGLRGGKLARGCLGAEKMLSEKRSDFTPANWAFAFLESIPNVGMILSGMSDLEQVQQNIDFFGEEQQLTDEEMGILFTAAHLDIEANKDTVPCTACRYCTSKCPMELDIPGLLKVYNEHVYTGEGFIAPMFLSAMEDNKKPGACLGCGECAKVCPQKIDIPGTMKKFAEIMAK
ncbi:MAG: aldo/keto reductase [Mogibacterium sp.]|nr:aldo/keto reductase [Mogibacterium sp.]